MAHRCTLFIFLALALVAADQPASSRQDLLNRFRKMSAEERLQHAEKVIGAKSLVGVTRADLDLTVTERGSLESADATDIVCPVKSRAGTTVKWVIDDGSRVKKGDRLLELDSTALREQLRQQLITLAQATARLGVADRQLELVRKKNQLDDCTARLNLKVAQLGLKRFTGKDTDEKEVFELKVEQASLALQVVRLENRTRESLAQDDVKSKAAALARQEQRKKELDKEIAACVITAPQDGVVVHYVPEQTRGPGPWARPRIVAQGEAVQEGQKLLRICGLDRFTVMTRVHEAQIHRVRAGQPVVVHVDAFPGQVLNGKVKSVATVASQQDWLRRNVKVYSVEVEITDKNPRVKPGMSASVSIEVGRRGRVLLVPVEAVLGSGRETFCYVKVGKGLEERKVTTGERNDRYVEIREGLKDGDQVLRTLAPVIGQAKAKGPPR
jgi:RND family efflux transporter MFP subunit